MSVQTREITKTVMQQVMVCDRCATVGPEIDNVHCVPRTASGWVYVTHDDEVFRNSEAADRISLCSWKCVADYADDKNSTDA